MTRIHSAGMSRIHSAGMTRIRDPLLRGSDSPSPRREMPIMTRLLVYPSLIRIRVHPMTRIHKSRYPEAYAQAGGTEAGCVSRCRYMEL